MTIDKHIRMPEQLAALIHNKARDDRRSWSSMCVILIDEALAARDIVAGRTPNIPSVDDVQVNITSGK